MTTLSAAVAAGFLLGSIVTTYGLVRRPPVVVMDDAAPDISVVSIEGIRDGALRGVARGNVRVVAGDEIVSVDQSGSFMIRDSRILTNTVILEVPPGMHFVASKRGKKYYSVDSSQARNIVPENRIYFPDEISARQAGYIR